MPWWSIPPLAIGMLGLGAVAFLVGYYSGEIGAWIWDRRHRNN